MKSILITTGIFAPDIGGPASYARLLGTRLAADGVRVTLVTYSSVWSHAADAELPFRIIRVWRRWPWGLRHLIYLCRLWSISHDIAVILALNAVSAGVPASWVARRRKARFVVRIVGDYAWDMALLDGKTRLMIQDFQHEAHRGYIARLRRLQTRTCAHADAVIVPARCIGELVVGWGIPDEKISTIYTGTDLEPSRLTKEEARKSLGISGNIILTAGRLIPLKGFRMLIKVMPQLLNINQFFRLFIVGDGPQHTELRAMVRNLNLERKVILVGHASRSEMAAFYAAADMFVLNSGFEAFPNVVLEALRAGVPLITTAVGGNCELINQGDNGFLIKYNDEFNLVEAMKAVWENEDIRERFISHGKTTAERFNVQRMYQETKSVLEPAG
jgi:glycosyltransferase involved in cell wall biosynthesis